MINFAERLTFPKYPFRSPSVYWVYCNAEDFNVSLQGSFGWVENRGKVGDNLYEISLFIPDWEDSTSSSIRTATLYMNDADGTDFECEITQYGITQGLDFSGDYRHYIEVSSEGGHFQFDFSFYNWNSGYWDLEDAIVRTIPYPYICTNIRIVASPAVSGDRTALLSADIQATDGEQRVTYLEIECGNASTAIYETICIIQNATTPFPVWKDTFYGYDTYDDYADYSLNENGLPFFNGRAYAIHTGTDPIEIPLSNVMRYYLPSNFTCEESRNFVKDTSAKAFSLKINNSISREYFTWNDYSYEDTVAYNKVLSAPIDGLVDVRQLFVLSFLSYGDRNPILIENSAGTSVFTGTVPDEGKGIYNYSRYLPEGGDYYVYTEGTYYRLWTAKLTCNRYCLIYQNKYGGYDSFLIQGKNLETDSWTNLTYKKNVNNTTNEHSNRQYLKDISTKWLLHTTWLTDEQASRMDNLFESNVVFLQDLEENKIYPVVITDVSLPKKTYSNQGNKLVSYDINVETSRKKIRR